MLWTVIDAKLTERAIKLIERTGVVKLTVIGLIGIIGLLVAGETRAERAHQAHVVTDEAREKANQAREATLNGIARAIAVLAEDREDERVHRRRALNVWIHTCKSQAEVADRNAFTCELLGNGKLDYGVGR